MTSAETRPVSDDDHESDLGRLNALVDGVVAIAITLLAIDLKPDVQHSLTSGQLARNLFDHLALYVTFAISFALVAQYWTVHRQLMRRVRRTAPPLTLVTFVFLFAITLAPFLTSLNGTYANALTTFLFALDVMLLSGSTGAIGLIVWRRHLTNDEETSAARIQHNTRLVVNLVIPALVAALAWVIGSQCQWLFFLFIFADVPGKLLARRSSGRAEPGRQ